MKKIISRIIFSGILLLFVFCNNKINEKEDDSFSANEVLESSSELENEILNNGSVEAYEKFRIGYLDDENYGDFYKMAKIMADKYSYTPAYYDVFSLIYDKQFKNNKGKKTNDYNLDLLDSLDKKTALEYLIKGAKNGESQSIRVLEKYRSQGKYLPPTP